MTQMLESSGVCVMQVVVHRVLSTVTHIPIVICSLCCGGERTLDPGHLSCQQTTAALCTLAQPSSPTVLEHSVLQLLQLSTYDDPASPQTAAVVHFRKPLRAQVTVSGPHPTSRHKFRGCSSFQSSSSEQSPAAVLSSHSASAEQSFSTN